MQLSPKVCVQTFYVIVVSTVFWLIVWLKEIAHVNSHLIFHVSKISQDIKIDSENWKNVIGVFRYFVDITTLKYIMKRYYSLRNINKN